MAVTPGFIDELRSRLSLSDLVGRRVKLVPKGRASGGLVPLFIMKKPRPFMSMILKAFIIVSAAGRMAI